MSNNPILVIQNVNKNFGIKNILNDLSYEFYSNKIYAIKGVSGSGKTTFLNIIGLLDNNYQGSLIFDNESLKNNDYHQIRANKIGFIFQSYYLIDDLTVKENIILPLKYSKNKLDEEYLRYLIKTLKVDDLLDEKVNYLSGGEKQRISIARALINKPKLIICDEPTGNLDKDNANNVFDMIKSFVSEDRTIIVVTHSEEIASKCDVILELKKGKLYER